MLRLCTGSVLARSFAMIVLLIELVRAYASLAPVSKPTITAAAILPRANTQTLGWYSSGKIAEETICMHPRFCRKVDI